MVLLFAGCLALFFPSVQSAVARWLAGRLSDEIGATISIDRVALSLDGSVRVEGLFVGDLRGDTLFQVPALKVRGLRVSRKQRAVDISNLVVTGARFNLATAEGE